MPIEPVPAPPPAPIVLPTGWRANTALAQVLSLHTLLWILGAACYYLSTLPSLASLASLFQLGAEAFGFTGAVAAISHQTPVNQAILTQVKQAGLVAVSPSAVALEKVSGLVPFLLLPLLFMGACAHLPPLPTPDPGKYAEAYKACLTNAGVSESFPEGAKIFGILDQGGNSAIEIEQKIEQVLLTVTADVARVCIDCAVTAWDANNSIPAGAKPTFSQTAVRLYHARHLSRPTLHHSSLFDYQEMMFARIDGMEQRLQAELRSPAMFEFVSDAIDAGVPMGAPEPSSCFDNLCGGADTGERYCSCHKTPGGNRCWTSRTDCDADAKCCASGNGHGCDHGLMRDACTLNTAHIKRTRDKHQAVK